MKPVMEHWLFTSAVSAQCCVFNLSDKLLCLLAEIFWDICTPFGLAAVLMRRVLCLVCRQIHKQAPPLEDIPEDCSAAMRSFLGRALERNPALRSSASELLKDDALNPPREDQPRCWSLDSALEEATHALLRQPSQHHDTTQGKPFGSALETVTLSDATGF